MIFQFYLFLTLQFFTVNQAQGQNDNHPKKYILYDTNPGEGFNLRRDVYMRIACLVKSLNNDKINNNPKHEYVLVLPPWGRIGYHWGMAENKIKWSEFFNLEAIRQDLQVIEFEDFLDVTNMIDHVWYLQAYKEGWDGKNWQEKLDIRECLENPTYTSIKDPKTNQISYKSYFFGYQNSISAKNFVCMSVQGHASILKEHIFKFMREKGSESILIDRAESVLHDKFGQYEFWRSRRSMQFSKKLYDLAVGFQLESGLLSGEGGNENEIETKNEISVPYLGILWAAHKKKPKTIKGHNFLAAHIRRRDFLRMSKHRNIPSISSACQQLLKIAKSKKLNKIFIATDGDENEIKEIKEKCASKPDDIKIFMFQPNQKFINDNHLHKGSIAIIDQIICSHAAYFIGTEESTFSFRIHDERTINGFADSTTFNHFCGDGKKECGKPTNWEVIYDKRDEMY